MTDEEDNGGGAIVGSGVAVIPLNGPKMSLPERLIRQMQDFS